MNPVLKKDFRLIQGPGYTAYREALVPTMGPKQYDAIADQFLDADLGSNRISRGILHEWLDEEGVRGKRVLDMGFGYGLDAEIMAGKGASVFGIDESEKFLSMAQQRCPSGTFAVADFSYVPRGRVFAGASFDVVYSRYALQHTADLDPAFLEAARAVRPGGSFMFLVTHPLRQYFEKPTRDYFMQEVCSPQILDKKLVVEEPSHTFAEYFSPIALNNFNLEKVVEIADPASKTIDGAGKYPGILCVKYRRNQHSFFSRYDDSNTVLMMKKLRAMGKVITTDKALAEIEPEHCDNGLTITDLTTFLKEKDGRE